MTGWLVNGLRLTRAHFLAGGVGMYALGVVVVALEWPRLLWGQMGVSAIQLMTHLVNEFFDAERDALITTRTLFSGGSGVLPAGQLPGRVAVVGGTLAGLLGLAVALTVGWPTALVYVAALGYGSAF